MAADSIASMSDSQLKDMALALHGTVSTTPANYGLSAAYVTALQAAVDDFSGKLDEHITAQTTAKAKTAAKDTSRSTLEAAIREARGLAKAAKIAEATYTEMGIPTGGQTAPSTATSPAASVNTSERLRHTLSWTDGATLDNRKKPRGAMGAEIWVKIDGPPPGNEQDCTFLTLDAFTPYLAEYGPSKAGKTAHYMLRWRMRDGSVSAWGETVSATITG